MTWKLYEIDRTAHDLVLEFRDREVLGESHKMRATIAYGLERFWGEHLRLSQKEKERDKSDFWKATWDALCKVMKDAGITVPNDSVNPRNTSEIKSMAAKLWDERVLTIEQRKVALAVLIEICDSLVWWTQRYKK
ncbi:hypothetical protein BST81_18825 [Leptolyngbya sp. 'hensonii']|uniref:hypothetical protein n=1 Tax=Leptolyngbya sp. 'hensonii' TaxID=1922337 RepID=UPI00094F527F|nr:hypothetical protein [Leptolyngbya sp. 'hensonii']OLP16755.1 hypothetical protein BST81_18825 [Leptolyngbya sp. 'hensonii']